jgi:prolyl-tRNA editing enzyme YbaK/EbsC (Cys-tRNA(Pro) deacylase)
MRSYEDKLKKYIRDNNVVAEHLSFNQSCHSVAEAALAAGVDAKDFVKSICMIDSNDSLIVGIVKGEDRVSISQTEKILSQEISNIKLRLANPEEMLERTGYPCGGTPGIGYVAKFLIDTRVMDKEYVYMGGGSEQSLVKISTKELQKANNSKIVRLRK